MRIVGILSTVLACVAAASPAQAQMKQFRDWVAACDNARRCAAYGIVSTYSLGYLRIARDSAPDAKPVVTLAVAQDNRMNFTLSFDRQAPDILPSGTHRPDKLDDDHYMRLAIDAPIQSLVTALRKATRIIITPEHDPDMWSYATLDGAIDALAWIDRRQKRAGTVTAMVARGRKPASAIPAPPPLPTITAAKPDPEPVSPGYPPALVDKGNAICGKEKEGAEPRALHRLGPGLLLYWFFCRYDSGAYNLSNPVLLVPEAEPARAKVTRLTYPPAFAAVVKSRHEPPFNVAFDATTMTLAVNYLRRSPGDCGEYSEWRWDGQAFRLALYLKMPVCAGILPSDWPALYRAVRN